MISIIILNYNTFDLTVQCIRSVYAQTKGIDFEIILVDNASTECNPDKFKELFPDIVLVKNTENRGFSRGCNDGLKYAKGDYILLLNSDTVLLNNAIGITYHFLVSHSEAGIATCRLENKDGPPQNNCQRFPSKKLNLFEKLRLHKFFGKQKRGKIWFGPYFNYNETAFPDWVWGTFFMFPKSLLQVYPENKLPETFWMYVEDMEWCWLARKAGYKVAFIPDGRVLHFGGNKANSSKKNIMIRENLKIFLKNIK
ncbi:MAG: glycosyltransferase family 2 protein [Bacteroidales bacterium]